MSYRHSIERRRFIAGSGAFAIGAGGYLPAIAQQRELLLGIVNPLTGPGADLGVSAQQAIDPVLDEVNKAGGIAGMRVEQSTAMTRVTRGQACRLQPSYCSANGFI